MLYLVAPRRSNGAVRGELPIGKDILSIIDI